ncbi:hypothetical protein KIH74_06035 [Kineosporia sp. J2-2]|uniref:Uncharacterized protein n=1 Tax=Kineosporia corallincola TaxID=2835133 RepID=A0ABS5TBP0_9ACTN|nr:hypothetical protein [Kineosporia corallincola]MBT0768475.1 hypothetical protein [Kineosporia corallincola]
MPVLVPLLICGSVLSGAGPAGGVVTGPGEGARPDVGEVFHVRPALPATTRLRLLGVHGGRVTAVRNGVTLLTGRVERPGLMTATGRLEQDSSGGVDLRGDLLRWMEDGRYPARTLHTLNLVTGESSTRETSGGLVAWTPGGWLEQQDDALVEHHGDSSRVLFRGLPEGASSDTFGTEVVSDGERTLISYTFAGGRDPAGFRRTVLVTDGGETVETLAESGKGSSGGGFGTGLALAPGSEVWATADGADGMTLHRRRHHRGRLPGR